MKKLLSTFPYLLLYGPIISSYILAGYRLELLKRTEAISGTTMIFIDKYFDTAFVTSSVVLFSIVTLLCVAFFTKKKILSPSLWLHCDIVFVLWLFFISVFFND